MGILYNNGVEYGGGSGGGDNSKIVTYEQYQNLSEAEKNSNTTYYVSDYPSVSSGEIVDNLESTATDKALSANMGRELAEQLGGLKLYAMSETDFTTVEEDTENGLYILYE